jgi:hypothetical protein
MNNDLNTEIKIDAEETGPPKKYTVPLPEDTARCVGCPYPGVGFVCWGTDGSCMRTEVERISRRSRGR